MVKDYIENKKLIVVARGVYGDDLIKLAKALYDGGIRLLEVAFEQNVKNGIVKTGEALMLLQSVCPPDMALGVGTVLCVEQAEAAVSAGAQFIVSPNVDTEVIAYAKQSGLVSIAGAMTPTEMVAANRAGADYIKIFPAARLGIGFIKDVCTPLSHIKFVAAAGITEENISDFFTVGCTAAAVSGRLVDKKEIKSGNFKELSRRAAAFSKIVEELEKAR
jgi:2-keto-3-deoxy-6-phosphogluconate aldolase